MKRAREIIEPKEVFTAWGAWEELYGGHIRSPA